MANIKKRKKTNFKNLFLVFALCGSGYFIFSTFNEVLETKKIKDEISVATIEKEKLEVKKAKLDKEKENLQNPEYVLRYARGKYLVTKDDGEQVFRLPEEEE